MAKPLSKVLYFLGILDDTDIEWMVRTGRKRSVPAGSIVIQEGEPIDSLFIILGGEFKVTSRATGDAEIARRPLRIAMAGRPPGRVELGDAPAPVGQLEKVGRVHRPSR